MKNLIYRRQFVFSNQKINPLEDWNSLSFALQNQTFYLSAHPDLAVLQAEGASIGLTLLGNIIDPLNPECNSADILQSLASCDSFESVLKDSFSLSGRFIIICIDQNGMKLFNDAMAFREVFYLRRYGLIACSSTASLLDRSFNLGLDMDNDFREFYTSKAFNSDERVMIGDRTMISGVRHLMPNHYLDMQTMESHRFWPISKELKPSVDSAIDLMSKILTGTFKAIVRKKCTVHQSLTSGWDTRLLLAASKNYLNDIHFFFLRGHKSDEAAKASVDYQVALKMATELGLDFEAIDFQPEVADECFKEIYYSNNTLARPKLLPAYYHAYISDYQNTLIVSGVGGNEILRILSTGQTDGNSFRIASIWKYQSYRYVTDSIDRWFRVNEDLRKTNYRTIDLFFWEQMFGNWGNLSGSEQDIVREELRPFNNRAFIAAYIGLPLKYRYRGNPLGHINIIKKLWPELLGYDMDTRFHLVKKLLRKAKLEHTAAILFNKLKRLKK